MAYLLPPLAPLAPDDAAGCSAAGGAGVDLASLDAAEALLHGEVRWRVRAAKTGRGRARAQLSASALQRAHSPPTLKKKKNSLPPCEITCGTPSPWALDPVEMLAQARPTMATLVAAWTGPR
jgi:hypothetical protein